MEATIQELSFLKAHLTLPICSKERIFMSSFDGFLAFGILSDEKYEPEHFFTLYFENYCCFAKECIDIIKFYSKGQQDKPDIVKQISKEFSIRLKPSNLTIDIYNTSSNLWNLSFNIFQFTQFMKSFKVIILSTLVLTFEQRLFLHYLLKKENDFERLKNNPHEIISIVSTFTKEYCLKNNSNMYIIEIFEYHFDLLLYLHRFTLLLLSLE